MVLVYWAHDNGWWYGAARDSQGWFPGSFVEVSNELCLVCVVNYPFISQPVLESSEAGSQAALSPVDNLPAVEEKAERLTLGDEITAVLLKRQEEHDHDETKGPEYGLREKPEATQESPLVKKAPLSVGGDLQSEIQSVLSRLGSRSETGKADNKHKQAPPAVAATELLPASNKDSEKPAAVESPTPLVTEGLVKENGRSAEGMHTHTQLPPSCLLVISFSPCTGNLTPTQSKHRRRAPPPPRPSPQSSSPRVSTHSPGVNRAKSLEQHKTNTTPKPHRVAPPTPPPSSPKFPDFISEPSPYLTPVNIHPVNSPLVTSPPVTSLPVTSAPVTSPLAQPGTPTSSSPEPARQTPPIPRPKPQRPTIADSRTKLRRPPPLPPGQRRATAASNSPVTKKPPKAPEKFDKTPQQAPSRPPVAPIPVPRQARPVPKPRIQMIKRPQTRNIPPPPNIPLPPPPKRQIPPPPSSKPPQLPLSSLRGIARNEESTTAVKLPDNKTTQQLNDEEKNAKKPIQPQQEKEMAHEPAVSPPTGATTAEQTTAAKPPVRSKPSVKPPVLPKPKHLSKLFLENSPPPTPVGPQGNGSGRQQLQVGVKRKTSVESTGSSTGRKTPSESAGSSIGRKTSVESTGSSAGRKTPSESAGSSIGRKTSVESAGSSAGRKTPSESAGISAERKTSVESTGTGTTEALLAKTQTISTLKEELSSHPVPTKRVMTTVGKGPTPPLTLESKQEENRKLSSTSLPSPRPDEPSSNKQPPPRPRPPLFTNREETDTATKGRTDASSKPPRPPQPLTGRGTKLPAKPTPPPTAATTNQPANTQEGAADPSKGPSKKVPPARPPPPKLSTNQVNSTDAKLSADVSRNISPIPSSASSSASSSNSFYKATRDYQSEDEGHLKFTAGDIVILIDSHTSKDGFLYGMADDGSTGLFPLTHVQPFESP